MRMADRGFPEAQEKNMINQKSKMSEEHCSVITTGETEQSGSLSWSFMQHELVDEAIRQATTKPRDWTRENTRNEVVWSPS